MEPVSEWLNWTALLALAMELPEVLHYTINLSKYRDVQYKQPGTKNKAGTLVSQIVEHTEINEHVGEIAENLIVEYLLYTISIATNNRTPGIFFNCVNSQY